MKNIQFTLKQDDYDILNYGTLVVSFVIAGIVGGCVMPEYLSFLDSQQAPLINAAISIGAALFAWSAFCFIRPIRYDRNWQIAEFMLVPAFWLLLTLAVNVWLLSAAHIPDNFEPTLFTNLA